MAIIEVSLETRRIQKNKSEWTTESVSRAKGLECTDRRGGTPELARMLIRAGVADPFGDTLRVKRGSTRVFEDARIWRWANIAQSSANSSLKKYRAFGL